MAAEKRQLLVTENAGQTREVALSFGLAIGAGRPVLMLSLAGVDPVEEARQLAPLGPHLFRLPARPGPYADQALTPALVRRIRRLAGVPVAAEVQDGANAAALARAADALVVAGGQMQNFPLLKALGRLDCPVLLERGPSCTVDEWLMAAEYILAGGNRRVVLLAGPTRAADGTAGWMLDLVGALAARQLSCLPVMAEAVSAAGPATAAPATAGLCRAILAAGLDGLALPPAEPAGLAEMLAGLPLQPGPTADLRTLRAAIDGTDAHLLEGLCRRMQLAQMVGRSKAASGLPVYQPEREQEVLARLRVQARGRMPLEAVRAIWALILHWSRDVQRPAAQARASR